MLQSSLFSASELSNIGHELDQLEAQALDDDQALQDRMGNVGMCFLIMKQPARFVDSNHTLADDSGFFSVGVIEKALQVVGLRLVRWESQDMQPFRDNPEHQAAFILNLQQHWFSMRKFADSPDLWFNLNSFLEKPGQSKDGKRGHSLC